MASGIPGFVGDLRGALGALRRYDDGRNFPIPAYWEEKARRFGGTAQQRQTSDQPTPVFSRGLATIAERSLLRVQRYFSRRIHHQSIKGNQGNQGQSRAINQGHNSFIPFQPNDYPPNH